MSTDHETPGLTAHFGQQLTGCQSALYSFITTLLGGAEGARDVLQETNLVLWKKAADYDPSQPFQRWAYTFARFQTMAWLKKQSRSRLVLDEELVQQLAAELETQSGDDSRQLEALDQCLRKLPPQQRELVTSRYFRDEPVQDIAARLKRPPGAVAVTLFRIRKILFDCIQASLAPEVRG